MGLIRSREEVLMRVRIIPEGEPLLLYAFSSPLASPLADRIGSVKSAGLGNLAAMAPSPSVGSASSLAQSASIESLASNLMLETS
jgi:hypothetical protein